jgi:shikimate kinase
MARIYLVGFMGAGKSTVGKKLAKRLGYRSLDLDDAFEQKFKINIQNFFYKYDEPLFRDLERQLLASTYELENVVISTGGGTPAFFNSIDEMNGHGITIYLKMSISALANRLQKARRPRPLIRSIKKNELKEFIQQKLVEREPFYKRAQLIINAESIDIETVVELIKKKI